MEDLVTHRNVIFDLLALATGLALGIVIVLFWCVEVVAGQSLPVWYYAIGLVAMTAATYAQLQQQRGEEEA
jgi:hypothetical protein